MKTLQEKIDAIIFIPKHMQGTTKYAQAEDLKYDINQAIQELREEILAQKYMEHRWRGIAFSNREYEIMTSFVHTMLDMIGEKK